MRFDIIIEWSNLLLAVLLIVMSLSMLFFGDYDVLTTTLTVTALLNAVINLRQEKRLPK